MKSWKNTLCHLALLLLVCSPCWASELKVVNWNILYSFNRGKSEAEGMNWLRNQDADVVGLQELNKNTPESLSALAKGWGHPHSVLLKRGGFPVGLTSKTPIEVIEKAVKGYHHGHLHCKTAGIHFFIVHFWPGKEKESADLLEKVKPLLAKGEKVILMGDFNSYSRKDEAFLKGKKLSAKPYLVVDRMEQVGLVDVVHQHDPQAKVSFPSPVIIPRWAENLAAVKAKQKRIDFIFTSKNLSGQVSKAGIVLGKPVESISDHYPVFVEFKGGG